MSPDKPTYKELETRLARSEAIIASLTGGEIDAVLSGENISLLRTVEEVETMRLVRCELERLIEERTAELAQSREKYRRVVDNIHDALITDDIQGRVTFVNDRFLKMFGISLEKVDSLRLENYLAPEWQSVLRDRHDRRMRGKDIPAFFEYEAIRPDGKRFWVEELVTPVVENGIIIGTQSSIRDITERKRAEKAIEESKLLRKELEHMSRVISLSGLTASIAHELNQPLAAIRSNAQAAVRFLSWDSPDIEEVRKALVDIIKDNRRADDVIRGLRSLVKRENFELIDFDINTAVHEIISLLYNEVLEYEISIKMELADDLPPVYGDRVAVSQVVLNLMLNGIQAMAGLEIDSRELVVRTRQTDSTTIEFSVIDFGNGIGEDQKEQIFKPFYTTKANGMGMGLAICRSIIEANDGLIWFTNEPDRGTNFHFTLPVFRKA
ncbi:MAG TPA: PAS domain S-box protein [archaeon]|nr:PAS domain S-box protein [archaeon]